MSHDDVTILRGDSSLTGSATGGRGNGQADPPRVLKQRFVLDRKLGSGGMGTVFRAKDLRKVEARDPQPYVAVKVLNNDFRDHPEAFIALQREASKSQALSHRNIVSIYDFDKDGDVPFITMELLEGQELSDLLRAYPTGLPESMAWRIIQGLCDGLEHAHAAGLVHADFKPGNVFVLPDGSAKILDFGIARAVQVNHADTEEDLFDPIRLAALTPAYASPEMLDRKPVEPRDDLFSLGVVIYLMLTGNHPYGRTPANQAATEAQRPERPRGLSRRRWRALERCLAFERAGRPTSVGALSRELFQPSPWRSRTALVALLAVVLSLAIGYFRQDAAVDEARTEARQVTLLDAQVARVEALVQEPGFTSAWEEQVAEEAARLRGLLPESTIEHPVFEQIRARYLGRIHNAEDLGQALDLYQRGLRFGPLPDAAAHLEALLVARLVDLLDGALLEQSWLLELDGWFMHLQRIAPRSTRLQELRLEAVAVLEQQLEQSLAVERFPAARMALGYLETYSFAPESLERLQARVDDAERSYQALQQQRRIRVVEQTFRGELAAALDGTCLQLDPAPAAAIYRRWVAAHPELAGAGRDQVTQQVGRCLAQLAALDRDRAAELQRATEARFGRLPGLHGVRQDPCAAGYLVGNGAQRGRSGSCSDALDDAVSGPRLVVIPGLTDAAPFAITREEVSWADLQPFCVSSGRCTVSPQPDLPATGIPVEVARAYAHWLSDRTGFRYRLPTSEEWRRAAADSTDPDRNCRLQLGGVRRGLAPVAAANGQPNAFGLRNVLGNVQEWLSDPDGLKAAGGAYNDPLADCVVGLQRRHDGAADAFTGFRLVREIP